MPPVRVVADELDLDLARQLGSAAVRADHRETLGADRVGHEHVGAPGQPSGHAHRMAGCAAPAVDGKADEVHPDQLGELARELEPGLVAAVVRGRRAPDRRQELAAAHDLVADRGTWCCQMPPPRKLRFRSQVSLRASMSTHVPPQRGLGDERRRQLERALQAMRGRDLGEERLDVGGADGLEQLALELRRRVRHVRVRAHAATR